MLAVLKKELKAYFMSPVGYIFVGAIIFISSLFFMSGVVLTQRADISVVFSNINAVYLFLAALLTMRLFAEEKNKKTDQLLLSAPVRITDIVLGKYLAAMSVFGISLVISLAYPVIMCMYAKPAISEIIGSYVGFILLWGCFISIGVFVSSLTESQVIAGVLTFAALLVISTVPQFTVSMQDGFFKDVIGVISLYDKYAEFQRGILNIQSVIYYLSFIFVFLFLTVRIIDKRRYS